jgi:hypothetical protein
MRPSGRAGLVSGARVPSAPVGLVSHRAHELTAFWSFAVHRNQEYVRGLSLDTMTDRLEGKST